MSIFSRIIKKEKPQEANYLSLVLAPDRILASIWTFDGQDIKVLGFGQKSSQNVDVLVHQAAYAIDAAGEQAKVDVNKAVFGICEYYLEDGTLTRQATKMIKKISDELDLIAQAFIPIAAAVNHLLKIEESTTPNTVTLGIFADFCEVSLLVNNTVVKTKTASAPVNIEKIKNLLTVLTEDDKQLPARVVVYGLKESSDLAQKLSSDDWGGIFLQHPKVDFLDDSELSRSVAYAQAADILGREPNIGGQTTQIGEQYEEDQAPIEQKQDQPETPKPVANELGFVAGVDIHDLLDKKPEIEPKPTSQPEPEPEPLAHHEQKLKDKPSPDSQEEYAVEVSRQNVALAQDNQEPSRTPKTQSTFSKLTSVSAIFNLFKFKPSFGKFTLIAAIIIFLAIAAGSVFALQRFIETEVVIKVNSRNIEKDFLVSAISGASFDTSKSQIGASLITVSAQGSQKAVTTGNKKTGEPARGEVTVFNWTSNPKTFAQGTTVITKSGLKFTIDEQIEATSASAPTGSTPSSPGKAQVKITAGGVGPSYNIDTGQTFTFSQFDEFSYSAQNTAPLTGGSERQVTFVIQEDINRLEKSLLETTTKKAKDELAADASGNLPAETIVTKVLKKDFDKKLDEETSFLNLNMEVEASALLYFQEDLKKILAESFGESEGFVILSENINITQLSISRKDNELSLSGIYKAGLVPKFSEEELKVKITGKSQKEARKIIREIPNVSDVNFNFRPNLPITSSVSRNVQKITIKVETN